MPDQKMLRAQLLNLINLYGADVVETELAKLLRANQTKRAGAPLLRDHDELLKIWLCVELYKTRRPGKQSISNICRLIAEDGGITEVQTLDRADYEDRKKHSAKGAALNSPPYTVIRQISDGSTIRRIYTQAKTMVDGNPAIAAAWRWQLKCALGKADGGALPDRLSRPPELSDNSDENPPN